MGGCLCVCVCPWHPKAPAFPTSSLGRSRQHLAANSSPSAPPPPVLSAPPPPLPQRIPRWGVLLTGPIHEGALRARGDGFPVPLLGCPYPRRPLWSSLTVIEVTVTQPISAHAQVCSVLAMDKSLNFRTAQSEECKSPSMRDWRDLPHGWLDLTAGFTSLIVPEGQDSGDI